MHNNMKTLIVVGVFLYATLVIARPDDEKYTTKYDNIDLDEILSNKRMLKSYVNCLLEKGPCSPDGAELKRMLPDALETECKKCSEKQKTASKKVLRHLIDDEPEYWKELEQKYDPTGQYKAKYKDEAKKEGFNI